MSLRFQAAGDIFLDGFFPEASRENAYNENSSGKPRDKILDLKTFNAYSRYKSSSGASATLQSWPASFLLGYGPRMLAMFARGRDILRDIEAQRHRLSRSCGEVPNSRADMAHLLWGLTPLQMPAAPA